VYKRQPNVDTTRTTAGSPLSSGQARNRNGSPPAEAGKGQRTGVETKPRLSRRARAILRDMKTALDTGYDLPIVAFHRIWQTVLEEEGVGVEELLPMIGRNEYVDRIIHRVMREQ
jgi:hypothetical protein